MSATTLAMLATLRIKNLALVADLTLELQPGYNAITGETGAGKSILIGALSLVLGCRADRTLVREGTDGCVVEAVFDVAGLKAPLESFLDENGLEPCDNHQLVLKRTLSISGGNRQFVNGSPTALATLSAVGQWLVDIHGPHEHQSLLQPARQLSILDAFGGLVNERNAFTALCRKRAALEAEKAALIVDEQTYARQLDLLRFQVAEIEQARLLPGEDRDIEEKHQRAGNAARLIQLGQGALELIGESDASLLTSAGAIGRMLQELQRIDPGAGTVAGLHNQAVAALLELQAELTRYVDRVDVDPEQLRELEDRLNLLQSLKRKYGASVEAVIAFGEEASRSLRQLEQRDAELERIQAALAATDSELGKAGRVLTSKRRALIPKLTRAVSRQLADLGFGKSTFDVAMESRAFGPGSKPAGADGLDEIEFQFSPNHGESARPLRAIASSGELARVMLALKTVLAAEDEVPVLVFDEVDANVGGETANAVGEKMRQIAARRQVLCITHLPQVAAAASAHHVVTKQVQGGRTLSEIRLLDAGQRVAELTRMLGGRGEAARKHAESLVAGWQIGKAGGARESARL